MLSKRAVPPDVDVSMTVVNTSAPVPPSPGGTASRTPSPSLGNLFRPNNWFRRQRTTSSSKTTTLQLPETQHGSSNSLSGRMPRISEPKNPRPLPPSASRSVLELGQPVADGQGDLRAMSKKQWSRSYDDLSRMVVPHPEVPHPSQPSQRARIEAYRAAQSPDEAVTFPSSGSSLPLPLDSPAKRPRSRSFQAPKQPPPPSPVTPTSPRIPVHPSAPMPAPPPPLPVMRPSQPPMPPPVNTRPPVHKPSFPPLASPRRHNTTTAAGFGFGLGPTSPAAAESPVSPPIDPRRTSQIIHVAGFLNKHPSVTSAGSAPPSQNALAKGWKPYKVVVKGPKLLCYKPPTDRATAVKDLFPVGTVNAIDEGDEDAEQEEELKESPVESRTRARRAYWGTAKHPELVLGEDGTVHSGTLEALVHECIYATATGDDHRWRAFSSAVLLCLPRIAGKDKFEAEFMRYAGRMLPAGNAERVAWLVATYLRHSFVPSEPEQCADLARWREWCAQADVGLLGGEHPTLDSWFAASELPGIILNEPSPTHQTFNPNSTAAGTRRHILISQDALASLRTQIMSREALVAIPVPALAESLRVYFEGALSTAMKGSPAEWVEATTTPSPPRIRSHALLDAVRMRDFSGSDNTPHWLSHLILNQLLLSQPVRRANPNDPPIREVSRAQVLVHWVKVGEHAHMTGDWTTWRSIAAALCAKPVARLDKLWRRIEGPHRGVVQTWSTILMAEIGGSGNTTSSSLSRSYSSLANSKVVPRLPWLGDLPEQARNILQSAGTGGAAKGDEWEVEMLQQVNELVTQSTKRLAMLEPDAPREPLPEQLDDGDLSILVQFWNTVGHPERPTRDMRSWMEVSMISEGRLRGRYVSHFWTTLGPVPAHNVIPTLFVEGLPTISFMDRGALLRTKKESLESDAVRPAFYERSIAGVTRSGRPSTAASSLSAMKALTMFDGELTLLVQPGELASENGGLERKMSVNHGIRVSPAGPTLERKSSAARRSSLPILNNTRTRTNPSTESTEAPLSAIVRAGTLERLVDVLVHGLQGITVGAADDNGEMSLREGGARPLKVDQSEFNRVWWYTFRSFVTPIGFFELLRKRYLMSMMAQRVEVLQVVEEWLAHGCAAQDALDNPDLYDGLKNFLTAPSLRSARASGFNPAQSDGADVEGLERRRKKCLDLFLRYTLRPRLHTFVHAKQTTVYDVPTSFRLDEMEPWDLVNSMDATVTSLMRTIQPDDFFLFADCLEALATDSTAWYNLPDAIAENGEIQTIYSLIQDLPLPDTLWNPEGPRHQTLLTLLPATMRGLFNAYNALHKWLLWQIAAPALGLQKRERRMNYFLAAIEICRARSVTQPDGVSEGYNPYTQPCPRSMVETLLTNVVLSGSSRCYHRAWANVAASRNVTADSLTSLLARSGVPHFKGPQGKLCPDFGWAVERVIEILCMEDTVANNGPFATSMLVNMEKRRSLADFVTFILGEVKTRPPDAEDEDIARINALRDEVRYVDLQQSTLLEAAHVEAAQGGRSGRRIAVPFQAMIFAQQEKNKRDRHLRHHLVKVKRVEQARAQQRDEDISRAMMSGRRTNGPTQSPSTKHQRGKKSMSALYKLMRPLSTAFSTENLFDVGRTSRHKPADLDFEPTGAPAFVISLVDARVSAFVNNQRSFVFHLDTEDGGRYLFQAMSKLDMNKWIAMINKVAQTTQRKRLTFLGSTPNPPAAPGNSQSASPRDPVRVFGVELSYLIERETGSSDPPAETVPRILNTLLGEIETRGLGEEGIYRIAGVKSTNDSIKQAFNSGRHIDMREDLFVDIYSLCDTVKAWFRELPGGLIPPDMYDQAVQATQHQDFESRLDAARELVHGLPPSHFAVLHRIIQHLHDVTSQEEHNHMSPMNLAIVFSGNLFHSPDGVASFANMGYTHQLTRLLILNFVNIFSQPPAGPGDADADRDADEEVQDEDGDGTSGDDVLEDDDAPDHVMHDVIEEEDELEPVSRSGRTPVSSPGSDIGRDRAASIPRSYFPDMPLHVDTPPRIVSPPAAMTDSDHALSPVSHPS